jgi:hypothetical protein
LNARAFRIAATALVAVAIAACTKVPAGKAPEPATAFTSVIQSADKRVSVGDYAGADRILADFALKQKGTNDATEIAFWRALYMIDPSNRTASMGDGIRALDIYLTTDGASLYKAEALVLKRTAQTVMALRSAQQTAKVVGRDTVFVNREDEIAGLKDQLAKANAELERIKKRLANPGR